MSLLGQNFFVVDEVNVHLGNFTVHWNKSIPPAVGSGWSQKFVITCEQKCVVTEGSCQRHVPKKRDEENDDLGTKRHLHEVARIKSNKYQPDIVRKHRPAYTKAGYMKCLLKFWDVSPEGWALITEFYEKNKDTETEKVEKWDPFNTFVNHWEVNTTMIPLPQATKKIIWRDLSVLLGVWADIPPEDLIGSSIYGVRRYWNGSYLENHVDRPQELILSVIINIDQGNMQEPWPLEVFNHQGIPSIVLMDVGDIVLYESATVIHGRRLPMRGEYFANVFAHTKPIDWDFKVDESKYYDYT